jgi:hypothetical protein
VTCGPFDETTRHYRDDVVVTAVPLYAPLWVASVPQCRWRLQPHDVVTKP